MTPESPTAQRCCYCHGQNVQRRAFALLGGEALWLFRCSQCRAEALVPQPSERLLAEQYARYYQRRVTGCADPKATYFAGLVRRIAEHSPHLQRVVDLGAGEGFFAQELLRYAPSATIDVVEQAGVPLVRDGVLQGRVNEYAQSIEEWLQAPPAPLQYDVVTALDIVEHLRDPARFIEQVFNTLLKPSGILVLTTPNAASLSCRTLGRLWPHYKVEHLTYPTPKALRALLSDLPAEVIALDPLTKQLPLRYCTNVLSSFGPLPTRAFGAALQRLLPKAMLSRQVRIPTGESILIAQKLAAG